MYLTSFIHRDHLVDIAERWFCGKMEPKDVLRLTEILISDGFVIRETLEDLARNLLSAIHDKPFRMQRIHFKGELRDALCLSPREETPRIRELFDLYQRNPDFYYREAPINGVMCLDEEGGLLGLYRIKRPTRIAEKANRHIANWIFRIVQEKAQEMAEARAREWGIPLGWLFTPPKEMVREFVEAEKAIAMKFKEGTIRFDRAASTINDVAGLKIVAEPERLARLESVLSDYPGIQILEKEYHTGNYRGTNLILKVPWDRERVCRKYAECGNWSKYENRGISAEKLRAGLEPLLEGARPDLCVELILATFPDMVESELGNSIHEERLIAQRDDRTYKGYIPMNVEFLIDYLFAVGFSPRVEIDRLPIKLWGRYLPDTLQSHIRQLYRLPDYDLIY